MQRVSRDVRADVRRQACPRVQVPRPRADEWRHAGVRKQPAPDHQQYVRKVTLPSGKTIEVISFDDQLAPAQPTFTCAPTAPPSSSTRSPGKRPRTRRWEVSLRCPNCEWTVTDIFEEEAIQRFDETLDRGTEALVADLRQLSRANMEDDVERFIMALNAEHVLPEDF